MRTNKLQKRRSLKANLQQTFGGVVEARNVHPAVRVIRRLWEVVPVVSANMLSLLHVCSLNRIRATVGGVADGSHVRSRLAMAVGSASARAASGSTLTCN